MNKAKIVALVIVAPFVLYWSIALAGTAWNFSQMPLDRVVWNVSVGGLVLLIFAVLMLSVFRKRSA